MKRIPLVAAVGAALMYFFDPSDGKRRRNVLVDRIGGFFRGSGREAERAGRYAGSQAHGLKQKATHLREEEKPQPNDATLKAKVESEIFREAGRPKDKVDVNAENGVVYLRGEVDEPELIAELEAQTRKVQGVQGVENLLHLPGEPVPTKQ